MNTAQLLTFLGFTVGPIILGLIAKAAGVKSHDSDSK